MTKTILVSDETAQMLEELQNSLISEFSVALSDDDVILLSLYTTNFVTDRGKSMMPANLIWIAVMLKFAGKKRKSENK